MLMPRVSFRQLSGRKRPRESNPHPPHRNPAPVLAIRGSGAGCCEKVANVEVMMEVTREMISAAHRVTMDRGDVILSADLLTRIYEAMHAARSNNPARRVSYVCPVWTASLEPGLDSLRAVCDGLMVR